MAEDHHADWPRNETNGKSAKGRQRPRERTDVWKEELIEDQRRCRAVKDKVIPLDGRPNKARQDDRLDRPGIRHRLIAYAICECHSRRLWTSARLTKLAKMRTAPGTPSGN